MSNEVNKFLLEQIYELYDSRRVLLERNESIRIRPLTLYILVGKSHEGKFLLIVNYFITYKFNKCFKERTLVYKLLHYQTYY